MHKTEQTKKTEKNRTLLINWVLHIISIGLIYKFLTNWYKNLENSEINNQSIFINYFRETITVVVILIHIFYTTLYYFKFPIFEKMKVNSLKWPWEENLSQFKKKISSVIILYLFNQIILGNIFFYIISFIVNPEISKDKLPSFQMFWLQIFICIIIEDFFFYWGHRLLHHPLLYNKIHKIHHSLYNVIHISYAYAHPLEFILANLVPMALSLFIFQNYIHIVTFTGFVFLRTLETAEGHSGYEFIYSIFAIFPFSNDSVYHDFHHLKNMGNYGSFFRIWDTIFGTNEYFYELEKSKMNLKLKK